MKIDLGKIAKLVWKNSDKLLAIGKAIKSLFKKEKRNESS